MGIVGGPGGMSAGRRPMFRTFFTSTADKTTQPAYNHAVMLRLMRVMVDKTELCCMWEREPLDGGRRSIGTRQNGSQSRSSANINDRPSIYQSIILHRCVAWSGASPHLMHPAGTVHSPRIFIPLPIKRGIVSGLTFIPVAE